MQTTFTSMNGRLALALVAAILLGTTPARAEPPAAPAKTPSTAAERQARGEAAAKAFVLGRYDDALAIYLDLYVQSDGRPEYLRNIGRCQQKLHQDDRAIESFREYLRQAKRLGADERREVQGFITEIETARKNTATPAPPDLTAPVPYGQPPPSAMPPLMTTPPPPATSSGSGLRTVGIITVIAAAALAGAGTLELLHARSLYNDAKNGGCADGGGDSTCDQKADSVASANLLSKILYGVAGAAAVTGTVFLVIAPSPGDGAGAGTRLGLTARWRF